MPLTPSRAAIGATLAAVLVGSGVQLLGNPSEAAVTPTHHVTVAGAGVSTFPSYTAALDRFAVQTTDATAGQLQVTASTTQATGTIRVNGRPLANGGTRTLTGLEVGDEVNVQITDSAGTSNQSWIYLPTGFPTLTTSRSGTGPTPGKVFLSLATFASQNAYETIVDDRGVPIYVLPGTGSDLKVSDADPTHYSVARRIPSHGYEVLELDRQFRTVASHQLDGIPDSTDFHDAELLPGGGALLLGYNGASRGGKSYIDSVIQVVDAAGDATFTWDSKDHVDPAEAYVDGGIGDYAHINSVQMLSNGDILASFRNLSQVMRIATTSHDGYSPGDVIWRLGGEQNDFTFVDDPLGGNCAQHIARILPNGHLMVFDNGSRKDTTGPIATQSANMCPDPANPGGDRIARPQSRVTEYALDEDALTATLVSSIAPTGRYAAFAGSQQVLANGNTFVGWSRAEELGPNPSTPPIATEVDSDTGNEVWSLTANGWFSYRAFKYAAPDKIKPVVTINRPTPGASYAEGAIVEASYGCTDRGGSNLKACSGGGVPPGGRIDTTAGAHTFTVRATDGNGNVTTRSVHYTVVAAYRPDGKIRKPGGAWLGNNVYGALGKQTVTYSAPRAGNSRTAEVMVQNDGTKTDQMRLRGTASSRGFKIRYFHGATDVSARMVAGTFTTAVLQPGQAYSLRVVVTRTAAATHGSQRTAHVKATSGLRSSRVDDVAVQVRAT